MVEDSKKPGLRDRKRTATRARIEAAAVDLVLRDGLEAATVDAISERADISPRTFFNYFDSKDAAILGLKPQALEDDLAEQVARPSDVDPIEAVVDLVVTTMGVGHGGDADLHQQRVEIMRRHPEVASSQFAQLNARKNRLVEQVRQLLARTATFPDDAELTARATIALAVCASAVHAAVETWVGTADSPAATDIDGPDDADVIRQRALSLIHSTLKELL
ncbi:TetR/AcrR family transcriptional regulator [Nocardioides sp. CER19]|uniref:TetR/AcrR family transcriptional regulator n=1 Tax=Nocardioides sp. CER19 TaxID=3038538 RepID=UPI00244D4075|nr:TetR/AcrR family transcriptional regulator [Nocardioides sp. CER19]MDH2416319.1 TetR/AcrR family transcriptional regulator [Nocardioides sp. CER19]